MYSNLYSVGSLVAFLFAVLCGLFLVSLPNRSRASFNLGMSLFSMSLVNLGYFLSSLIYHPLAAYHRLLTVSGALFAAVFSVMFLLQFPEKANDRAPRKFAIPYFIYNGLIWLVFAVKSFGAPEVFHFDGHFWDYDLDRFSAIIGIFIFANIMVILAVGVRRFIKTRSIPLLVILIAFVTVTVIPGYLNVASRDGLVSRAFFVIAMQTFNIVGYFIAIVLYINTTKDRTTFLAKIVGISLVMILLVMEFLSYSVLTDKEGSYDELRRKDSELLISRGRHSGDQVYQVKYDLKAEKLITVFGKPPSLDSEIVSFRNTAVWADLLSAAEKEEPARALNILAAAPPYFQATGSFIAGKIKEKNRINSASLHAWADSIRRKIVYHRKKLLVVLREKKDDFSAEDVRHYFGKMKNLPGHRDAMDGFLKNGGAAADSLNYIYPVAMPEEKIFRTEGDRHYPAFQVPEGGFIHEIGYSYRSYRNFIAPVGNTFTFYLLGIVGFILIGSRLFLHGALIAPLDTLLKAVGKVNKGNLDVEVRISVEDEIGFLSRSFNNMVSSIRDARQKLEAYANELEDKVKERTRELQQTLEEVQALKVKQDGDYFLTSLLIQPLSTNTITSKAVSVEFLTDQFKKFSFRKWKTEIGGDLNVARSVTLRDREYSVFLNADAMGKSIQGAGGALVLGAVFQSIIERTRLSKQASEQYPERWLKNAFVELHKVFEAFDGSMLVSLVVCMIDDESGIMYFINAEHPSAIIYRDKTADFLEETGFYRKLGTTGMDGTIQISAVQLYPGDVVYLGSDGRDDIAISEDAAGNRVINEDHTLILKYIVQADGDIRKLAELIRASGKVTDDLTLVRAGYRENQEHRTDSRHREQEIKELLRAIKEDRKRGYDAGVKEKALKLLEEDASNKTAYKELVRSLLKLKDYKEAATYAEDYSYLRPDDLEMIYVAAYCYKILGKVQHAADLGERVRLRSPHMLKNLINLADIYVAAGNPKRGWQILEEALRIEPENPAAMKLKNYLETKYGNEIS